MILAEALKQIGSEHLSDSMTRINCYNTESTWSKGYTITNFMRNVCWFENSTKEYALKSIFVNCRAILLVWAETLNSTRMVFEVIWKVEGKECPVEFGAKKGDATLDFFRVWQRCSFKFLSPFVFQIIFFISQKVSTNPLYQNMYKYMMANPGVLTSTNKEGVERAYAGVSDYGSHSLLFVYFDFSKA